MKTLIALVLFTLVTTSRAAEWKPADIHPKVFQMVACWISDTTEPIVTEIDLDAVRADRNQFDYGAVKKESEWITFREERTMLRFRVISSKSDEYSIAYQENGGGSLTTQRIIRFVIMPRSLDIDGRRVTVTVLRIIAISAKE